MNGIIIVRAFCWRYRFEITYEIEIYEFPSKNKTDEDFMLLYSFLPVCGFTSFHACRSNNNGQ